MMYFDAIAISEEEPELNYVVAYCSDCARVDFITLDKIEEIVDEEYVTLKEGINLICEKCGKEHKGRKIEYRKRHSNIPHCPICQSTNLKKISTGSKIFAAATMGGFAIPYTSKTFECQNCGYKI